MSPFHPQVPDQTADNGVVRPGRVAGPGRFMMERPVRHPDAHPCSMLHTPFLHLAPGTRTVQIPGKFVHRPSLTVVAGRPSAIRPAPEPHGSCNPEILASLRKLVKINKLTTQRGVSWSDCEDR